MVEELEGGQKSKESTLALFRARKYLQKRFGSVHVNFGEPISLADALGENRPHFESLVRGELAEELSAQATAGHMDEATERIQEEKRSFIERFGHHLVERINWLVTANATSVASVALMGTSHTGLLRTELVQRMQQLVDLLQRGDAGITSALRADQGQFTDSIAFMIRSDLVKSADDPGGEIIYFEESKRRALDIYRNSVVHYLAIPSVLARSLRSGATAKELVEDVLVWREILYREFFTPGPEASAAAVESLLGYFEASGWIEREEDETRLTAAGEGILSCLDFQTRGVAECYEAVCRVVAQAEGDLSHELILERSLDVLKNAQRLGLSGHPEAANEATFGNALDLLVARQILVRTGSSGNTSEALYAPGEEWGALGELHELLARPAAAR